ncbi:hypothetical protein [Secundilactobacillus folii]|uniref:Uncharacterized protein n=1 Tax=Secundilactobacillus folii TaxID=2678357 RepID=A0A7X2XWS8_9LACO|nr:hypothetical protein [Secundilactobacillus folii]MTV82540.1 hypothetical protein [Secundilactobacillus folii]
MLDIKNSIERLQWNTEHHFLHIQAQHEFMRALAIQFELGYTDFRVIQMTLQMGTSQHSDILKRFTSAYEQIYQYEYAFVAGGLEGFNEQFGNQMTAYEKAEKEMLAVLAEVQALDQADQ